MFTGRIVAKIYWIIKLFIHSFSLSFSAKGGEIQLQFCLMLLYSRLSIIFLNEPERIANPGNANI